LSAWLLLKIVDQIVDVLMLIVYRHGR
jgi:hypothetical protein